MIEGERIIKLETQMENIKQQVNDGFKATEKRFDAMEKIMTDFVEKSEKKFASKWVENAVYGTISIIGVAVIGAVLKLVINNPIQ